MTNKEKSELFNIFSDNKRKCVYIKNDVVYLWTTEKDNVVYGISLRDIVYEGGTRDKLIELIDESPWIKRVRDVIDVPYTIISLFNNNKYIIPYLLS